MKIKRLTLKNFRGYKGETTIEFGDLTTFIGRNDVGKSTIVEALDIFFNSGDSNAIKFEKSDINNKADDEGVEIGVCFTDLPKKLVIDSSYETSLKEEYLLNKAGELEVIKKGTSLDSVVIRALHPTNEKCSNLLSKKIKELKKIVELYEIPCSSKNVSSVLRKAIWDFYSDDLCLAEVEVPIMKSRSTYQIEKSIYESLEQYFPTYALFRADRKNNDKDAEVQDPLDIVVKDMLKNDESVKSALEAVSEKILTKIRKVSELTIEKLNEVDPKVAKSLSPTKQKPTDSDWKKAFQKVSFNDEQKVPINKRGSGVRRLILLSFFRAQVELNREVGNRKGGIVYAVEEPETSQHVVNRRILVNSLKELSKQEDTQVVLTTHSPTIVKELEFDDLRIVRKDVEGKVSIKGVDARALAYKSLNEINFIAFGDASVEYHNELYGYIKKEKKIKELDGRCDRTKKYVRPKNNGEAGKEEKLSLHTYIRHQIHHPENTFNERFTREELEYSVNGMRQFIIDMKKSA